MIPETKLGAAGVPLLRDEQRKRNIFLGLRPFPAVGDKDARIRSALQPQLEKGSLYVHENIHTLVREEQVAFPQSRKKDILDMLTIAINNRSKPLNQNWKDLQKEADKAFANRSPGNATRY